MFAVFDVCSMLRLMTGKDFYFVLLQLWALPVLPVLSASLTNVALTGTASQSGISHDGEASLAIDGNKNPDYAGGFSCTHTLFANSHWWRLLLPAVYRVSHVDITNRDELAERINGAELLIGNNAQNNGNNNPRCAVIDSIGRGQTRTFDCGGMIGRFVNVKLERTHTVLTLCELEVYGEIAAPAPSFSAVVMGRSVAVVEKELCWSDALFYCRDFYWDLLSIRSEEEQREVEEVLRSVSFPLTERVWLGLRRYLMGKTWFWMSGDTENFDYFETQSIWEDTSPCGAIDTSDRFHWGDLPCEEHRNFICLTDYQPDDERVEFYSRTRP